MNQYKFAVMLCGRYAGGFITIEAKDEDEAYGKAMEYVGATLYNAFPTLSIEYGVEPDD